MTVQYSRGSKKKASEYTYCRVYFVNAYFRDRMKNEWRVDSSITNHAEHNFSAGHQLYCKKPANEFDVVSSLAITWRELFWLCDGWPLPSVQGLEVTTAVDGESRASGWWQGSAEQMPGAKTWRKALEHIIGSRLIIVRSVLSCLSQPLQQGKLTLATENLLHQIYYMFLEFLNMFFFHADLLKVILFNKYCKKKLRFQSFVCSQTIVFFVCVCLGLMYIVI